MSPYTIVIKVHNDTTVQTISSAIAKTAPTVTAPTAKTGLTYTGSAQALITAGSVTGGTMQYSLDGTTYSTTIPTGTASGSYTVYYKVVGDDNHNDTTAQTISAAIAKSAPTVTAPTAKTGLTYTGEAQALINAGSATGGTMQYLLDGTTYNTTIPTGTASGSYTVYYKVVDDDNHNDNHPSRETDLNLGKSM